MNYTFSWAAFFFGLLILAAGGAIIVWYQQIANNFGGSYDRVRMWGMIGCAIGLIIMLNLHSLILTALLSPFFSPNN